ncbi:hypothetical protein NW768_006825 [Fusarium equiseti]|uniref:Nephrocystin 3-like N-terminal domain-containing protein n=1 Tax=Fusarium equiseti TaxID=61235 RepID=A0ABQ8R9C6_FUSEQ|nr:hypothetical protein NW768_006825 [Fusarium equiseti]
MPKSANTADEYDFVDHEDTALSPELVAQLREWLQPTDYLADSGEYRRHLLSQAPGTGLWICKTEEYRKWHGSPDHGSLWIKGVPGAGKSVMTASLIQHLKVTENCPVLFFFFRNIVAANFSPRALIQDWLAQLLPCSPKLQFALQPRLGTSLEETSDNDLIELFLDGVSCVPKLYCVGDALDEMSSDNKPFLEKLNSLATHRPRSLKLLMTSRPKQYLQSTLRDSSIVHVSLQQQLVNADILAYLNHRFNISLQSDNYRQRKQDLIDMMAKKSEGLFLYAKLTMDQVEESLQCEKPMNLAALEESLPVGLEQTYTSVLAKQRRESSITTDVQLLVLEAVTHASRPLRLNELASLLECLYPDLAEPKAFKPLIAASCGSLIEILEDETLQVIHHSFTEFLRGDTRSVPEVGELGFPIIDSLQAHRKMTINCLRYLQSGTMLLEIERSGAVALDPSITFKPPKHTVDPFDGTHEVQEDPFDYRDARLQHAFLGYAVENWSYHASFYDEADDDFFQAITSFLNPKSISFLRWLVFQWGATSKEKGSTVGIPTPLHLAAFAGLSEFARKLLEQKASVSALDAQERTPLHWASANGHVKVVTLLLQYGADPDAEDGRGVKPLHLATLRSRPEIVRLLLEAGVDPATAKMKEDHLGYYRCGYKKTKGECALKYAGRTGHVDTVLALAQFCDQPKLEKMLCLLCEKGRSDAVLALLNNSSVSPDAMYRKTTALYLACMSVSSKCVEALINRGANTRELSTWYPEEYNERPRYLVAKAPIHELAHQWEESNDSECQEILKLLLKAGADIDQPNSQGNTALLEMAGFRRSFWNTPGKCCTAVKALIEAGADVKVPDNTPNEELDANGQDCASSVLHRVARNTRDLEVIKILVDKGCDTNGRNGQGETILLSTLNWRRRNYRVESEEKIRSIVEFLLENGADPSCQDHEGNSSLSYALSLGPSIFKLLFSQCQDMKMKKKSWFSLSSIMSRWTDKFKQSLEMFLAEGFDIETKDERGRTLYLQCCVKGSWERLDILRDYGANVVAKDNDGNNTLLLYCVVPRERCEELKELVGGGISPFETNNNGDNILHLIARWYSGTKDRAELVRWLVDLGVPVNAVNNQGSTPMHLYQEQEPRRGVGDTRQCYHFIKMLSRGSTVDLEILDNDGFSPLHIAATRSEAEVVQLIDRGANVNFRTSDSQNALHMACRARKSNVVAHLLKQGIEIDIQDNLGRTPLYYACSSGELETVERLLKYGASTHFKASDRSTVLHACADVASEQCMWNIKGRRSQWLRALSPDKLRPGDSSDQVETSWPWYGFKYKPPQVAIRRQFSPALARIIETIINAGVDAGHGNNEGLTALDIALSTGYTAFVEVFYRSEKLLQKATEFLDTSGLAPKPIENARQRIRVQMALMTPRPRLESLRQDDAAFQVLLENPRTALGLLSINETATLINEAFQAAPVSEPVYTLFSRLMRSSQSQNIDHLAVIEKIPSLVNYYSKPEGVRARFEAARSDQEFAGKTVMNALGEACSQKESNLLTVRTLVEKLKVDVNVRFACRAGDNSEPNYETAEGGTALHVVASAGHFWQLEALEYLLDHGADVNAVDQKGETALHVASVGPNPRTESDGLWGLHAVRVLLDRGADINILNNEGLSALHKSSSAPRITQELLNRGADTSIGVKSPLFPCIRDQNLETLEILLQHGLSPDVFDETRRSLEVNMDPTISCNVYPLFCAAFAEPGPKGCLNWLPDTLPLLACLVKSGADIYLPLNEELTLIHFLFEYPEHEVLEVLVQEPCASRIDFDRRDQRGRTVLMASCDWQRSLLDHPRKSRQAPKIYKTGPPLEILSLGADATLVDPSGKTALHHLLSNPGFPDVVLIDFIDREEVAPTLFQKDGQGYSPFHYALGTLRPAVCEALLAKGVDLLEPDPQGRTALHYIASQCLLQDRATSAFGRHTHELPEDFFNGCVSLWQKYLSLGVSINAVDETGETPLHAYLSMLDPQREQEKMHCHVERYSSLFPDDIGVDVFAVNNAGETMLHKIAARPVSRYLMDGHDKALFLMMMDKGLDPLKEDTKGRSALDVASACEKDDIVGLLGRK